MDAQTRSKTDSSVAYTFAELNEARKTGDVTFDVKRRVVVHRSTPYAIVTAKLGHMDADPTKDPTLLRDPFPSKNPRSSNVSLLVALDDPVEAQEFAAWLEAEAKATVKPEEDVHLPFHFKDGESGLWVSANAEAPLDRFGNPIDKLKTILCDSVVTDGKRQVIAPGKMTVKDLKKGCYVSMTVELNPLKQPQTGSTTAFMFWNARRVVVFGESLTAAGNTATGNGGAGTTGSLLKPTGFAMPYGTGFLTIDLATNAVSTTDDVPDNFLLVNTAADVHSGLSTGQFGMATVQPQEGSKDKDGAPREASHFFQQTGVQGSLVMQIGNFNDPVDHLPFLFTKPTPHVKAADGLPGAMTGLTEPETVAALKGIKEALVPHIKKLTGWNKKMDKFAFPGDSVDEDKTFWIQQKLKVKAPKGVEKLRTKAWRVSMPGQPWSCVPIEDLSAEPDKGARIITVVDWSKFQNPTGNWLVVFYVRFMFVLSCGRVDVDPWDMDAVIQGGGASTSPAPAAAVGIDGGACASGFSTTSCTTAPAAPDPLTGDFGITCPDGDGGDASAHQTAHDDQSTGKPERKKQRR